MHHLNIDLETYSSVEIGKAGLYKYVQSRDFEILLFGYSLNGAQPVSVDLAQGEEIPRRILQALRSEQVVKHAYNASFEWYCLSKWLGLGREESLQWLSQWQDTMLHGLYCGYPAGLDAAGKALRLPQDKRKMSVGRALIRYFCVPCKASKANGGRTRNLPMHEPEKWELFKEYNRQDVAVEQEIERRLAPWPLPDWLWKQWATDLAVNSRGVALDRLLMAGALALDKANRQALTAEAVALTGLDNPGSVAQLRAWLEEEVGEELPTLRKNDVADLLAKGVPGKTAEKVLRLRQQLGKTSCAKYAAMERAVCEDGRLRGLLQFYGANRTGRWAGRLVQVQNLPQTHLPAPAYARELVKEQKGEALSLLYGGLPDTLSQLIRTAFVPGEGRVFVDCDFSAIEARVVAYLAGEEWALRVFRTTGKIYEATASQMFHLPVDLIQKGRPEYALRAKGKVATLALGYGGGESALVAMGALRQGLAEEELPDIKRRWREANPHIVQFWHKAESAAMEAVKSGRVTALAAGDGPGLLFSATQDLSTGQYFLQIRLPSGRELFYVRPYIGLNRFGEPAIHYWGANNARQWVDIETWGGKLTENIVQAFARDILAEKIEAMEAAGLEVVFHVHDEVVVEAARGQSYEAVQAIMKAPLAWAPGLPLNADGWTGNFYTKD